MVSHEAELEILRLRSEAKSVIETNPNKALDLLSQANKKVRDLPLTFREVRLDQPPKKAEKVLLP